MQVESLSVVSHIVTVKLCEVRFRSFEKDGGVWTVPVIEGSGSIPAIGVPDVPVVRLYYGAPAGAKVSVKVLATESMEIPDVPVPPVQSGSSGEIQPQQEWVVDVGAYSTGLFPEETVVEALDIVQRSAFSLHLLETAPVQFVPATNSVVVNHWMQFQVEFQLWSASAAAWEDNITESWVQLYAGLVINQETIEGAEALLKQSSFEPADGDPPAPLGNDACGGTVEGPTHPCGSYLVITADNLCVPFAGHASCDEQGSQLPSELWDEIGMRGHGIVVKKMSQIALEVPDLEIDDYSPEEIRHWIRHCDACPSYLLLIGDTQPAEPLEERVPTYENLVVMGTPTDNYYCADLSNSGGYDSMPPEIMCARIPAQTTEQIGTVAEAYAVVENKLMAFDPLGYEPAGTRLMCSASAGGDDYTTRTKRMNLQYASNTHGMHVHEVSPDYGQDKWDFIDCLDSAPSFVTYSGHGWSDALSSLHFSTFDVPYLSEVERLPAYWSLSCLTGNFDWEWGRSIAEELMLEPGLKGAAHFLGSTVTMIGPATDALYETLYWMPAGQMLIGEVLVHAKLELVRLLGYNPDPSQCIVRKTLDGFHHLGEGSAQFPVKTSDLVGFWKLWGEGMFFDYSYHGADALDFNSTPGTSGRDAARCCDGSPTCYVEVEPYDVSFDNELTVSAWFFIDGDTGTPQQAARVVGQDGRFALTVADSFAPEEIHRIVGQITLSGGPCRVEYYADNRFASWTNVVMRYDSLGEPGRQLELFINGNLAAWKDCTGAIASSAAPLKMGEEVHGCFDEVRVYASAVPAGELEAVNRFDSMYMRSGKRVEHTFDTDRVRTAGVGPEFLGTGPALSELDVTAGNIVTTEGISGRAIFLEPQTELSISSVLPFSPGSDGLAWTDAGWALGNGPAGALQGLLDEFSLHYARLDPDFAADALYHHPSDHSWAAVRYEFKKTATKKDGTPYHNDAVSYPSLWNGPKFIDECPDDGCVQFDGVDDVLYHEDAQMDEFSVALADTTLCYWGRADPDLGISSTSDPPRHAIGAFFEHLEPSQHRARFQHDVDRRIPVQDFLSAATTVWTDSSQWDPYTPPTLAAPDASNWHYYCLEVSRVKDTIRYYVDGLLAHFGRAKMPSIGTVEQVCVGGSLGDELGVPEPEALFHGELDSLELRRMAAGVSRQTLEAETRRLRSYWTLDGTGRDSWPSQNHLVVEGQPSFVDDGYVGKALHLEADLAGHSTGYLRTSQSESLHGDTRQLWLGAMFRTSDDQGKHCILAKELVFTAHNPVIWIQDDDRLLFKLGDTILEFSVDNSCAGGSQCDWHGISVFLRPKTSDSHSPYLLTLYYDGDYPLDGNGQPVSWPMEIVYPSPLSGPLYIGALPEVYEEDFEGEIDEVYVSSVPLHRTQMKSFHHRTVGIWDFTTQGENEDEFFIPSALRVEGVHGYFTAGDPFKLPPIESGGVCDHDNLPDSYCLHLDSVNGSSEQFAITRSSLTDDATREYTFAAWIRPDAGNPFERRKIWALGRRYWANANHSLALVAELVPGETSIYLNGIEYPVTHQGADVVLQPGVWNHVAFVLDTTEGTIQPYVNAQAVDPIEGIAAGPAVVEADFGTGCNVPGESFSGYLDQVYVVNRAVTAAEIDSMHDGDWEP